MLNPRLLSMLARGSAAGKWDADERGYQPVSAFVRANSPPAPLAHRQALFYSNDRRLHCAVGYSL